MLCAVGEGLGTLLGYQGEFPGVTDGNLATEYLYYSYTYMDV